MTHIGIQIIQKSLGILRINKDRLVHHFQILFIILIQLNNFLNSLIKSGIICYIYKSFFFENILDIIAAKIYRNGIGIECI